MKIKTIKIKIFHKVRDHCYYTRKKKCDVHSTYNLRYNMPNKISVVFHNGSNYDYHFIIKKLANFFEGAFNCLGEITEKYKRFSVAPEKEFKTIFKNGEEVTKTLSYKLALMDSARFIACSSNLVNNRAEGTHKIKCKY